MLCNYFGTVLFIIAAWSIGMAVLRLICFEKRNYHFYSYAGLSIGIAICALVAVFVYFRLGCSVGVVRIVYCVLTLICFIYFFRKRIRMKEIISCCGLIALFSLMILPGVFRGEKYYVYNGNIWDHYFYLSEVIYMSLHDFAYGWTDMAGAENISDILTQGFSSMNSDRPMVSLLCAVISSKGWGNIFFQAYLYLVMVWAGLFGAMTFALEIFLGKWKWFKEKKQCSTFIILLSLVYTWGFFGQLQYDINAWSQQTAAGCLLAFSCVYLVCLSDIFNGVSLSADKFLFLTVTGAGIFLIYPENTIIHGVLLVGSSVLLWILKRCHIEWKTILQLMVIPLMIIVFAALGHWGTVKFSISQIHSAESDVRQGWATFFDKYWLGYFPYVDSEGWPSAVKKIIALIPSVFGMFLLVPNYGISDRLLRYVWICASAFVALGILYALWTTFYSLWKRYDVKDKDGENSSFLLWMGFIGMLIFGEMFFRKKYWSAGKLLLYISPYIFLALIYPLCSMASNKDKRKKLSYSAVSLISCLFLICQVYMVGLRIYDAATNTNCTGYMGNYPSDQFPYLKETFRYDFDAKKYIGLGTVVVDVEDEWYQKYIKMALTYEGIPYCLASDVTLKGSNIILSDDIVIRAEIEGQ